MDNNLHIKIRQITTNGGIKNEHIHKIFDPFFTSRQKGTGLGIAISKHFVELHNGKISIESEPGKGTTTTIILPIGSSIYNDAETMRNNSLLL